MDDQEIVCYCDHVTKGELINAMEQGAKTLADIKHMTGACCSCKCAELNPSGKCCAQDIALVMREHLLSKKIEVL
ncbi:MAG: (2Fe-2S)-binding protein [Lachnospiraceae bacterium]